MTEPLIKTSCHIGEAPAWDASTQTLYWVDATGNKLYRFATQTQELDQWIMPKNVAGVFPTKDPDQLLVLLQDGLTRFTLSSMDLDYLCQPELPNGSVFNDAKRGPLGRIWAMTKASDHQNRIAGLYCFINEKECQQLDDGFVIGNGIGFSPDGKTFYCSDSIAGEIYRYPLDLENLTLGEHEIFAKIEPTEGLPDGLCIDHDGNLWTALWDGWQLNCYQSDGTLLKHVKMPVQKPTSCCLGGKDMKTLFVTSASYELTEEELATQPDAGCVFTLQI
jgi:sugar lactone lactonase YvrE